MGRVRGCSAPRWVASRVAYGFTRAHTGRGPQPTRGGFVLVVCRTLSFGRGARKPEAAIRTRYGTHVSDVTDDRLSSDLCLCRYGHFPSNPFPMACPQTQAALLGSNFAFRVLFGSRRARDPFGFTQWQTMRPVVMVPLFWRSQCVMQHSSTVVTLSGGAGSMQREGATGDEGGCMV